MFEIFNMLSKNNIIIDQNIVTHLNAKHRNFVVL